MESFKPDKEKSVDGLSNTKGSLKEDVSRNELVKSPPSATFITGDAGMQGEHSEASPRRKDY